MYWVQEEGLGLCEEPANASHVADIPQTLLRQRGLSDRLIMLLISGCLRNSFVNGLLAAHKNKTLDTVITAIQSVS